ncbi:hypothetical protein [Mycobacterium sp. DL592]|uniref:hypothetical protein n=1 Tax=Mycobacterium sp. DL592 TaxID=2675524 RepID=UPI001422689C|nr:hypothetical protein [Mycobacterium sp. DL592]
MDSSRYIGYVGGVAVAVGVGAAIAAGAQGTAGAETGNADSSSAASPADAGPKKSTAHAARAHTKPSSTADAAAGGVSRVPTAAASSLTLTTTTAATSTAAPVDRLKNLSTGSSARAATATTDTVTTGTQASQSSSVASDTVSVPWSPNPLRPMPPEPAPNDMPGPIWDLEQAVVNAFPDFFKPVPREIFEGAYRVSQMIPWVNVVVPFSNIGANLQAALAGDKAASQRIVNNLIVTIAPVAFLYYGYNEIADLVNLEQQALDLQTWAITTAWDVLDPFQLLHNRGESGLPLSTTTPPAYPPTDPVNTL